MFLNTKNSILIEDARVNDAFWGNGANGNGQNQLGQILMRVRAELQNRASLNDPYVSYPPSYYLNRLVEAPIENTQTSTPTQASSPFYSVLDSVTNRLNIYLQ